MTNCHLMILIIHKVIKMLVLTIEKIVKINRIIDQIHVLIINLENRNIKEIQVLLRIENIR